MPLTTGRYLRPDQLIAVGPKMPPAIGSETACFPWTERPAEAAAPRPLRLSFPWVERPARTGDEAVAPRLLRNEEDRVHRPAPRPAPDLPARAAGRSGLRRVLGTDAHRVPQVRPRSDLRPGRDRARPDQLP